MNLKTQITKLHYDKNAHGMFFNVLRFASLFYGLGSGFKRTTLPFSVVAHI